MTAPIDEPRAVRAGEELDLAALDAWLARELPELGRPLVVEQFPGGHSNLTYLVWAGETELVLRRPPFGTKVKTAHDMGREHRVLSRLHASFSRAPRPRAYCDDASVLGAPFYVMDRVRGTILRRTPPRGLELDPATCKRLAASFVDVLAELHSLDPAAVGLADFGKPEGYVERQVTGWTRRYADAKTDEIPEVDQIASWLSSRVPKESGATIIHNDYKFDNLVLDPGDPTRIIGVLDWEMSTLGDPLMDLGTALGYWVEPGDPDEIKAFAFGPTMLPGMPTRRQLADAYGERTGRDVRDMLFYFCFALFKTAVVAQQIYYRYRQGLTKDERFAAMIVGVRLLSRMAVDAAESGRM